MLLYQIELAGHLDLSWADWFDAAKLIHLPNGGTCLIFELADQSALLGLLVRLHGLGLKFVSMSLSHKQSPLIDEL